MPPKDARPVKKEEVQSEEDEKIVKKKNPINACSGSRSKEAKLKKEELEDDDFEKPSPKKNLNKADKVQKKKKKTKEDEKKSTATVEQNGKKREKKVFDLPGQRRETPEERDPLRIFYESLFDQVPGSEMAAFWMMESGLLPKDVAKKVYEKKLKKNHQQKLSSPAKAVAVKKTTKSVTVKKKTSPLPVSSKKKTPDSKGSKQSRKRTIEYSSTEEESEDDFVLSKKITKKQRVA